MAYPTYYPQYYSPYPQVQMPVYQPQPKAEQTQAQAQQPQIQNSGFVSVPNEDVAKNYPIALGTSVIFKNESEPYTFYTKTMGYSQFDTPKFEKYHLVKVEDTPVSASEPHTDTKTDLVENDAIKDLKAEIGQIRDDVDDIQKQIDALKDVPKKTNTTTKKRDDGDV